MPELLSDAVIDRSSSDTSSVKLQKASSSLVSDLSIERITDSLVTAFFIALLVKGITYLLSLSLQTDTDL